MSEKIKANKKLDYIILRSTICLDFLWLFTLLQISILMYNSRWLSTCNYYLILLGQNMKLYQVNFNEIGFIIC